MKLSSSGAIAVKEQAYARSGISLIAGLEAREDVSAQEVFTTLVSQQELMGLEQ